MPKGHQSVVRLVFQPLGVGVRRRHNLRSAEFRADGRDGLAENTGGEPRGRTDNVYRDRRRRAKARAGRTK